MPANSTILALALDVKIMVHSKINAQSSGNL